MSAFVGFGVEQKLRLLHEIRKPDVGVFTNLVFLEQGPTRRREVLVFFRHRPIRKKTQKYCELRKI